MDGVTYKLGSLHILFMYLFIYLKRVSSSGNDSMQSGKSSLTLRKKVLPPFSGSKTKPSKQSIKCRQQAERAVCEQAIEKQTVGTDCDLI
jgi:hypothetical protein